MILAAGLLVLVGLGLFVGGVLTGSTALYWACVGVCVVAAVLLFLTRRPAPSATSRRAGTRSGETHSSGMSGGLASFRAGGRRSPAQVATSVPSTAVPPSGPGSMLEDPAPEDPTVAEGAGGAGGPPAVGVPAQDPAATGAAPAGSTPTGARAAGATAAGATAVWAAVSGAGRSGRRRGAHAAKDVPAGSEPAAIAEPGIEEVEVTDLLLVVDLTDEVLVVDEHPRYHLGACPHLTGRETIPLPLDEAKTDGFTPCAGCAPDRQLAQRERARRGGTAR